MRLALLADPRASGKSVLRGAKIAGRPHLLQARHAAFELERALAVLGDDGDAMLRANILAEMAASKTSGKNAA